MLGENFFDRVNSYETKQVEGVEIEKEASYRTEEEIKKEAALEKFASLPLEDAVELVKPVVKVASFKESLEDM